MSMARECKSSSFKLCTSSALGALSFSILSGLVSTLGRSSIMLVLLCSICSQMSTTTNVFFPFLDAPKKKNSNRTELASNIYKLYCGTRDFLKYLLISL